MTEGLGITEAVGDLENKSLFNLMFDLRYVTGTHSFQNKWSIIDQFIVSGNMFKEGAKTRVGINSTQIFDMSWLIMEGATGAKRPFRTYQGPKYVGGYSDHLPILLDLRLFK